MPFLIVDISGYLFRAYHAVGDLRTHDQQPTGAIFGVLQMLDTLLRRYPSERIVCVADVGRRSFRHDIDPNYKAHRPPMPDDLRVQIGPLNQFIAALGLPMIGVEGVEADDVIATLTKQARQSGEAVIIASSDKDLMQLVEEGGVELYDGMRNRHYDVAGVREKFGVAPQQIADYLALVGDTSDNIPGVPKVGAKTAAKWLAAHNDLTALIVAAETVAGAVGRSLRESIANNRLQLSRQLVTLRDDVPLPQPLEKMKRSAMDIETWHQLCDRYEFRQLRKLADSHPGATPTVPSSEAVTVITDAATLKTWCDEIRRQKLVAVDTETTGEPVMRSTLVGFSLSITPERAAYVPLSHTDLQAKQMPLEEAVTLIRPVLEDESIVKIMHNGKYDWHVFANVGIALRGVLEDTKLAAYVENSAMDNTLDGLAKSRLGVKTTSYKSLVDGKRVPDFAAVDVPTAAAYAGEDAFITRQLYDAIIKPLPPERAAIYTDLERPIMPVLAKMERVGMRIDTEALKRFSADMHKQLRQLEEEAHELAGGIFNLNSPRQIEAILFDKIGAPSGRKTGGGARSTDERTLAKLADDFPLAKTLLHHRTLAKLVNTYADKLPTLVLPATGRVHTQFSQTTVLSGRLSSSSPNLQNIPIRTEEGRRIRQAFVADKGRRILSADYSQIELRLMAAIAGDEAMIAAFAGGSDIHRQTAAEIFNVPNDTVNEEQRRAAKAINFGLIYGMSSFGLARNINISQEQAQIYIDRYFGRYPGIAAFMQKTRQEAPERGHVETLLGRRIPLAVTRGGRPALERLAINAPIQGGAADIMKMAMLAVDRHLSARSLQTRILLQVHDELVLEAPDEELAELREALPKLMSVLPLPVELSVNINDGDTWDEAH